MTAKDGPQQLLGDAKRRRLSGAWRVWEVVLLAAIPVVGVFYLTRLGAYFDFVPWQQQYIALVLGLALAAVFVSIPAARGLRDGFGMWLDGGLSLGAFAFGLYTAWRWPEFAAADFVALDSAVAFAALALIFEATRRTVGPVLLVIGGAALAFALTASAFPAPFRGRQVPIDDLAMYLYTDTAGMFGMAIGVAATVVLAFVLFGTILFLMGGGQVFIDLALALVGRYRGGPAKASVVASSLFGSVSGSAISNAVTTGAFTIPLIKRIGYPPHVAAGIEAVASTGGQFLPPVMGASAFLMADFLGVPYAEIAIAALVPALLFYFCLFVQVHLEAVRRDVPAMRRDQLPDIGSMLAQCWLLLVPLGVLIYVLFFLNWHATRAGLAAAAVAFVVGLVWRRGRIAPSEVVALAEETGRRMLDLLVITAIAGVVIGVLSVTGIGFSFALQIVDLSGGNLPLLLLFTALTALILGMGMPTAGVYILLAVLAAPALVQLGVNAISAHLFVLYFGMLSMITPPICLAAFATAVIAGAGGMRTGFAAMRLGGASYVVPFFFVLSPVLVLQEGGALEVVRAVLTAGLGVFALGAALAGYLFRPLGVIERVALSGICVLLVWPDVDATAFAAATRMTDVIGVALLSLGCALLWWRSRHAVDATRPRTEE